MFLQNYFSIFIFFLISFALSSIILILSYFLSAKANDPEKLSSYECGFSTFQDSRGEFDIRFYIVAMLFIIFDLEISFLFPFAVSFDGLGALGLFSMFFFLATLTLGFFYE
jgi:NADH-quinone oxidoreductase subunit A